MFSFLNLENRAFELGRLMALDGYPFDANPYIGLNQRLENLWIQGHAKIHALQRLAKKRPEAPLRTASTNPAPASPSQPPRRRPQLRVVR